MTDQPKWMPSEVELDDLVERIEYAYDGPNTSSLACSILAGAIRAAVEKALADLEVENAKLRACVEAADKYFKADANAVLPIEEVEYWSAYAATYRDQYYAARAEVDK